MLRWLAALALAACHHGDGPPANAPTPAAAATPSPSLAATRAKVNEIVLCKTTEPELRAQFGEPVRDGRNGDRRLLAWPLGDSSKERVLAVLIDPNGRVVDISWDAPGLLEWIPHDYCR
jgi:hypothetical protein